MSASSVNATTLMPKLAKASISSRVMDQTTLSPFIYQKGTDLIGGEMEASPVTESYKKPIIITIHVLMNNNDCNN